MSTGRYLLYCPRAARTALTAVLRPRCPGARSGDGEGILWKLCGSIRRSIWISGTRRANNFMGRPMYSRAQAFLQRPAAEALVRVHRALRAKGYGLLVFDGYRPWAVTKKFWDETPPEKRSFVADPKKGSKHNRGCAVDLSLYDLRTGAEVSMPSPYDDFTCEGIQFVRGRDGRTAEVTGSTPCRDGGGRFPRGAGRVVAFRSPTVAGVSHSGHPLREVDPAVILRNEHAGDLDRRGPREHIQRYRLYERVPRVLPPQHFLRQDVDVAEEVDHTAALAGLPRPRSRPVPCRHAAGRGSPHRRVRPAASVTRAMSPSGCSA